MAGTPAQEADTGAADGCAEAAAEPAPPAAARAISRAMRRPAAAKLFRSVCTNEASEQRTNGKDNLDQHR
jgi:hypothetical protein